jgi:hypothetical protein
MRLKALKKNAFKISKNLVSINVTKKLLGQFMVLRESFWTCKFFLKHFMLYNKFYQYILNVNTWKDLYFTINFHMICFHLHNF